MEPVTSDLFKKRPNPLEGQAKARPSAKSVKASFGKSKTQKNSEGSTENNAKRKSESEDTEGEPAKKVPRTGYLGKNYKKREPYVKPAEKIAQPARLLWEKIRDKTVETGVKEKCLVELMELVTGQLMMVALRSDTSRIIQCILKEGNEEQKITVQNELLKEVLVLTKDHYAHFVVLKMLKYGNKEQRELIIKQFYGQVRILSVHKEASVVLETAYCDYCDKQQKAALIQEFYGMEYAKFKDIIVVFEDIIAEPRKKATILEYMRQSIIGWTNKVNIVLDHSIIHRPMLQYMMNASYSSQKEMIEFLKDNIIRIIHTKDGAQVACMCVQYGSPKDRKNIVNNLKGYFSQISKDEFGHQLLGTLMACVDDTVLLKKAVLSEIEDSLFELSFDKYGAKVIVWGVVNSDSHSLKKIRGPVQVPSAEDPTVLISSSKKAASARQKEITDILRKSVLALALEHTYDLITSVNSYRILEEIFVNSADGEEKDKLIENLIEYVNFDENALYAAENDRLPQRKYHPMEKRPQPLTKKEDIVYNATASWCIKKFMQTSPKFCTMLFEKMKSQLESYAKDVNASWIVLDFFKHDQTAKPVLAELNRLSIKKVECSEEDNKGLFKLKEKLNGK